MFADTNIFWLMERTIKSLSRRGEERREARRGEVTEEGKRRD